MERRGHLDQPLQKSFFWEPGVEPDFLPGFVRLKKLLLIKESDAVIKDGLLFSAVASRNRFAGARVLFASQPCCTGRFGFRAQVPA